MDKRLAAMLAAAMAAASLGAWWILYSFVRPDGARDEAGASPAASFPGQPPRAEPRPAPAPAGSVDVSMGAPAERAAARAPEAESSLGFIQKDAGIKMHPDAPTPPAAPPQAAAQPPAPPAPPAQIRQPPPPPGPAAVRAAMQKVVDFVHKRQPGWYSEFLYHRDLRNAAERYDRSQDFPAFLKDLGTSRNFTRMLSTRAAKKPLRELIQALFLDRGAGPAAGLAFDAARADAFGRDMLGRFGPSAGVPAPFLPPGASSAGADTPPGEPGGPRRLSTVGMPGGQAAGQARRLQKLGGDGFIEKPLGN